MYVLTNEEMASIDSHTIKEFGIPGKQLMENAGKITAEKIEEIMVDAKGKRVLVVCGKGNNGGDGFVIARYLKQKKANVYIVLCESKYELYGDALTMFKKLPDGITFITVEKAEETHFDVVVDAVFGTGFKGEFDSKYTDIINMINKCGSKVVAVDIPSGVNGNTGQTANPCVKADYTFTFCCEKLGHRIYPGKKMCGKITLCDIGIPERAVQMENPKIRLFTKSDMEEVLRPLLPTDHKGDNGKLLIVGGSVGMAGSVCLAARGAMRSGVGLCYVAVPESIYPIVATKLTEAIIIPLKAGEDGSISPEAVVQLEGKLENMDAVVIGCGMSVTDNTSRFMERFMEKLKVPTVIDADGINILAKNPNCFLDCEAPLILTPHTVEMSRLSKYSPEEITNDRIGCALKYAHEKRITLVLKGDGTITTENGRGYINTTGNPGMAKGGSGDVLSGIIGAFLAAGMNNIMAAASGVFAHGMAGDYAAIQKTMRGMIASDIIENLQLCFGAHGTNKVTAGTSEKRLDGHLSKITKLS